MTEELEFDKAFPKKIKPCPHCGSYNISKEMLTTTYHGGIRTRYSCRYVCLECGYSTPKMYNMYSTHVGCTALRLWNYRWERR